MNSERTPRVRSKIVDSARCGFVPQTDTNPPGLQTRSKIYICDTQKDLYSSVSGALYGNRQDVYKLNRRTPETKRKQRGKPYRTPRKSNDKGEEFLSKIVENRMKKRRNFIYTFCRFYILPKDQDKRN